MTSSHGRDLGAPERRRDRREAPQVCAQDPGLDGVPPCPPQATREEWEAWYESLTHAQRQARSCAIVPLSEEAERKREERRQRAHSRWARDPFSYAIARGRGPLPRVDQIAAEPLSNTYRGDPAAGYCPHGFHLRHVRVPHRTLIEEQVPKRARKDAAIRLAWIRGRLATHEAELREALQIVLHERHRAGSGCRRPERYPIAWNALVHLQSGLAVLREMEREALREQRQPRRGQLSLFCGHPLLRCHTQPGRQPASDTQERPRA